MCKEALQASGFIMPSYALTPAAGGDVVCYKTDWVIFMGI